MQTQTHDLTFTDTEVRKRFVSWDDGEPDREWACLTVLAEHAPGLAPRPIRRETLDGHPVVVMERLAGEPLGNRPLSPAQTAALGTALRRMYDVPLTALHAAGIAERRYGPSTQAATVAGWLDGSADLSECQDPALVAAAVRAAHRWLASREPAPEQGLTALGIADLNPANVIWDGSTCRLVDFEDGGLTDPAFELADHVEHLAGRLASVYDATALADAVGLTAAQRDRMRAYRPLWAAFWLAMLLPGNGGFRRNPSGTTEAQAIHLLALLS
ncbi:phosphotransferase family protein [Nocardioides antri]|uniref:Aminoglycoside phosphotransferase family protein n=1 Tax=Nocardioides antri TaxID=2607659 RepID=A0A5B1M7K2_9ACTN|nr:aminoglycoside phosphotransferase family protein [Nocardioides antri]KAA1427989.1 aminoglycoside phosphotransferase family protein [Nocardioides antri]